MPIALFPELTAALARTGRKVAPWGQLVTIETQLLRRAESAFLVHWFGPGVPEQRLGLHIAVRNLAALRERYLLARESMPAPIPALSVLGPLSGIAGLVVGMAMSPTGAILLATQMKRIAHALIDKPCLADLVTLLYRIFGVFLLPVLGPFLALTAGAPLMLAAGLGFAAGGNPTVRAVVTLLGEIGLLIDALGRFWDQLSGPRDKIRNPLLKKILETLDRIAGLFVQLLGLVGIVLVRLAPLIPHLLAQFRAMATLIGSVVDVVGEILGGLVDALKAPFTARRGIGAVLTGVLDELLAIPARMMTHIDALIADTAAELALTFAAIAAKIEAFAGGLVERLKAAFEDTPLGRLVARIRTLLDLLPAVVNAFKTAPPPPSKPPGEPIEKTLRTWWIEGLTKHEAFEKSVSGRAADVVDAIKALKLPPLPDIVKPVAPAKPAMPDLDALSKQLARPEMPDFGALYGDARKAMAGGPVPAEVRRAPASAFAAERRALAAKTPKPLMDLGDLALRDLVYIAVGRVLPPALRVYAPDVRALFDRIDKEVYGHEPDSAAAEELQRQPMLDLGDSGLLRPVVSMLRFVCPDGEAPDLRAFRDLVLEAMRGETYRAAAAAR